MSRVMADAIAKGIIPTKQFTVVLIVKQHHTITVGASSLGEAAKQAAITLIESGEYEDGDVSVVTIEEVE